jgi:hypothetical protein
VKHIARFDGREWVVQTRVASASQSCCGRESMPGLFQVVVLLVVSAASWAQTDQASQTDWPKQVMSGFLISHGFHSKQDESYSRKYRNLREASLDLGFSIDGLRGPLNARNYVPLNAPRMNDYRTVTLHGWYFEVTAKKGHTLDDPTAPCSVAVELLYGRAPTYLPPDSSPTIHIKSVSISREFARPPSITFDVSVTGKTILAFKQDHFRINMRQSSSYGDDYRLVFPDSSPVIIVQPGQTITLRAEVQGDDLEQFKQYLKKGKWEVRVLFNSVKDQSVVDYQFLGVTASDNSFEAEVQ